jgi:hypothetical protein
MLVSLIFVIIKNYIDGKTMLETVCKPNASVCHASPVHACRTLLHHGVLHPRPAPWMHPSKTARSVNPRWANLILYAINGYVENRQRILKVKKQKGML